MPSRSTASTTPAAALAHHRRLRGRRPRPELIDQGALNFVIIGGGPTGVEIAGRLSDLIHDTMSAEYHHLAVSAAQIHIVDLGPTLLGAFSDHAHDYVAKVLGKKGVRLHLGVAVTESDPGT
jgi:NADH dehydrogenase